VNPPGAHSPQHHPEHTHTHQPPPVFGPQPHPCFSQPNSAVPPFNSPDPRGAKASACGDPEHPPAPTQGLGLGPGDAHLGCAGLLFPGFCPGYGPGLKRGCWGALKMGASGPEGPHPPHLRGVRSPTLLLPPLPLPGNRAGEPGQEDRQTLAICPQAGNPLRPPPQPPATLPNPGASPLSPRRPPAACFPKLEHLIAHRRGWLFPEFKTIIFINRIPKVI